MHTSATSLLQKLQNVQPAIGRLRSFLQTTMAQQPYIRHASRLCQCLAIALCLYRQLPGTAKALILHGSRSPAAKMDNTMLHIWLNLAQHTAGRLGAQFPVKLIADIIRDTAGIRLRDDACPPANCQADVLCQLIAYMVKSTVQGFRAFSKA